MKKLILLHFLLLTTTLCFAGPIREMAYDYRIIGKTRDSSLVDCRAKIQISTSGVLVSSNDVLIYGYDGLTLRGNFDPNGVFTFELDSGTYVFQFYLSSQNYYNEITTGEIQIDAGFVTSIELNFRDLSIQQTMKKPIIYLYPEEKTDVEVKVETQGEMIFMYPAYSDSWQFTAAPNGDLTFGDQTYAYLFWEAVMNVQMSTEDYTQGFVVEKENVVSFLESSLTKFGFSPKEQADFITFWGPQMQRYNQTFVHFVFNEACDEFAELSIQPTPDTIGRFYMIWAEADNIDSTLIVPQEIPTPSRNGFYVLEWGGSELDKITNATSTLTH